jgi:hypothetical protein
MATCGVLSTCDVERGQPRGTIATNGGNGLLQRGRAGEIDSRAVGSYAYQAVKRGLEMPLHSTELLSYGELISSCSAWFLPIFCRFLAWFNWLASRVTKSPFAPRKLRYFRGAKGDFEGRSPQVSAVSVLQWFEPRRFFADLA